jgi:hypothetical protein
MQTNIQIKDKEESEKIKEFHKKHYSYLSVAKFFIHAVNELMKREK